MENTIDINVFKHIGETLNSREAAILLFDFVNKNQVKNIVFDFTSVVFMSRSFADQFHKERMKLKEKSGLTIHLKDASESIRTMLLTVESTQNKRNRFYTELPVFKFSDRNLENYLLAL